MGSTLAHVRLLVDAYDRCFRFYNEALGFDAIFGDETSGYAGFDTGGVTLALHDATEVTDPTGGGARTGRSSN